MIATLTRVLMAATLLGGVLLSMDPLLAQKKQQTTVVNLTIHGDANTNYTILPDLTGAGSFRNAYVDYRAAGGDTCVQGEAYTQGLASVVTNRRMYEGGPLCAGTEGNVDLTKPRNFQLQFESADACAFLGATGDPCWVTPLASYKGFPHIRGETVFKSKATQTAMTIYFALWDESTTDPNDIVQYRLTSDQPAAMPLPQDSNTKTVVSVANATATLARHDGFPGGYVPYVSGIPLRFSMTFERKTVTTAQ